MIPWVALQMFALLNSVVFLAVPVYCLHVYPTRRTSGALSNSCRLHPGVRNPIFLTSNSQQISEFREFSSCDHVSLSDRKRCSGDLTYLRPQLDLWRGLKTPFSYTASIAFFMSLNLQISFVEFNIALAIFSVTFVSIHAAITIKMIEIRAIIKIFSKPSSGNAILWLKTHEFQQIV
ncbi:hypothetical protein Ferp_0333 [Ferroglobus placidus DSM 10642]|uniref:Uncharacterized protein n=1 Tax=Ferroglobus placidus (strain DSM 10642 / AEDII12DO) TaxID=589924 RepID=D3S2I2_FERPA|nr:hypothetical protein Ferp_0333 [Ferroglobus placidus DSM 10642]